MTDIDGFETATGLTVPAVTTEEMRAVDRVSIEEVGIELLQMMENAGRTLAWHARDVAEGPVRVVAGNGGNGGGGLACARHLSNHGVPVEVVLDRPPEELTGVAATQHAILDGMGIATRVGADAVDADGTSVLVDALIGYGLDGAARGPAREVIVAMNRRDAPVLSLDVPSGIDATSGETSGEAVVPDRTLTLALPKTGLAGRDETL
ncbi:MAG: NAD(P)H-hydrate epimerase, partial [Halalkalicoccus sp.]|nr:NAD(P)H-hydrate epimerase [Halalkalicoccus sp.]